MNARYQDPVRGQFISEDPIFLGQPKQQNLQDPQSLNAYSYSENNPIVKSDPSGKCLEDGCVIEAAAALGFAGGVESFRRQRFLGARWKDLVFPVVEDLLGNPQFRIHMRDEFRAGLGHGIVGSGGFQVPVRVDDCLDVSGKPEHILRVRGVATVHQETAAVAGKDDDIIARAGNDSQLAGELRGNRVRLTKCKARQTQRSSAGQGVQKVTASVASHGLYFSASAHETANNGAIRILSHFIILTMMERHAMLLIPLLSPAYVLSYALRLRHQPGSWAVLPEAPRRS